jgi:hypothetical protein
LIGQRNWEKRDRIFCINFAVFAAKMGLFYYDLTTPQVAVAAVVGFATIVFIIGRLSARKVHPNEPEVIAPWFPLIGHLLGMAFRGGKYVKQLGYGAASDSIVD